MKKVILLTIVVLLAACSAPVQQTATPVTETVVTPIPSESLPPVEGPDPSYKVAAFYYPWYGNPENDGEWIHWNDNGFKPPLDITSDYFPELGAYSSNDPLVVARHMAWLRQAGVGVIILSWWGQAGDREERPVPLILEMAQRYGIQVTFHIEPYSGRSANNLVEDVKYLTRQYGSHPAFFLSDATSRYSPASQPRPMFFVWSSAYPDGDSARIEADYWQAALDAIHALPQGGLMIADTPDSRWVSDGHFDGLYNYATLHLDREGGFAWAASLPPDSLYIPSVIPGFSAVRIGYSSDTLVPREDGITFAEQWASALGTGVQPAMVTITSFNEWHEGSQIEPPAVGADDGQGYDYPDFSPMSPDGYLALTRKWIDTYLAASWPETYRARIQITTSSDWTTLDLVSGGTWLRPELVSTSPKTVFAGMESGGRFALTQSLADAEAGLQVHMTWDLLFSGLDPQGELALRIDRGNIGETTVTIFNYLGETPVSIQKFYWNGITGERNSRQISIPASTLMIPIP